jgi:lipid-A-disaccharide synthase
LKLPVTHAQQKSCLVIIGEKSAEEHSLSFLPDLVRHLPDVKFFGVGSEFTENLGMENIYHLKDFSSWGFVEVIGKIFFYIKALLRILSEVEQRNCQVAILVDFQEFNYFLAKRLKSRGVEVLYYVAPQAWAWRKYRAKKLGQLVNTLFTIIPFERNWFRERGVANVRSVPHPLLYSFKEKLAEISQIQKPASKKKRILLLPGSRNFEVKSLLPIFAASIAELKKNEEIEVSLVRVNSVADESYGDLSFVDKLYHSDDIVEAFKTVDMCFAASGTVTLATALFVLPTIVCYKVSFVTMMVFRTFVRYPGPVSLANIFHQKILFPELLQEQVTVENIVKIARQWIENPQEFFEIREELKKTASLIQGENFSVSEYMANEIKKAYAAKK